MDFPVALAQIACAQILRGAGIDKCSPSLLNTLADLLIKHLTETARHAATYAYLSGRKEPQLRDAMLAMEEMRVISPRSILDPYEVDPEGLMGILNFIEWARGPIPEEVRKVSQATSQEPSVVTAGVVESKQTNALELAAPEANGHGPSDATSAPSLLPTLWLNNLIAKQRKVGQESKFQGTMLDPDNVPVEPDLKISDGPMHLFGYEGDSNTSSYLDWLGQTPVKEILEDYAVKMKNRNGDAMEVEPAEETQHSTEKAEVDEDREGEESAPAGEEQNGEKPESPVDKKQDPSEEEGLQKAIESKDESEKEPQQDESQDIKDEE